MTALLIDQIAAKTRISRADVRTIIETAPLRYKVYTIQKRDKSPRTIAHPSRELKSIQKALISLFPEDIPIHDAVSAYESGCSIKKNAMAHAKQKWLAKFDLENFFNSIQSNDWKTYLEELGIDNSLVEVSTSVFFWKSKKLNNTCLSVGAPSSPFVSNRIMFKFDQHLGQFAEKMNLVYTRYADDLAFSSNDLIDNSVVKKEIEHALSLLGSVKVNDTKTRLIGPGRRKTVTGIILTQDGKISLGRNRKRKIEAMLHRYLIKEADVDRNVLNGNLAFLKDIDPDGYFRLHKKFKLPNKNVGFKI